jgi:hypothetical protein
MAILDPNITPELFSALSEQAKLERLVYYASLAPSSHNTQPWLFKISDHKIELYPNWRRRLDKSDPEDRELYISLGAAITNLKTAAESFKLNFNCQIYPEAEAVALFQFESLSTTDFNRQTLEILCLRHCNRAKFAEKALPEKFLHYLKELTGHNSVKISLVYEENKKTLVADIVARATEAAFLDKGFTEELSGWIKPSLKKYRDGLPGYNIGIPYPLSFVMPWMVKHLNVSKQQRKMVEGPLRHSAAYIILSTEDNNKETWLKVGQIFEQIALEAQKNKIELGVLAAAIEIGDFYKQLQAVININTRPQMFFRLGFCDNIPQSCPRLPLTQIIKI